MRTRQLNIEGADSVDTRFLLRFRAEIDDWMAERDGMGDLSPHPRSSLAEDDRQTYPFQISHGADLAIGLAVDNLHCLADSVIVRVDGENVRIATRPYGLFALLRAALENAATAIWLLSPQRRSDRILRRVRQTLADARHADQIEAVFGRKGHHLADRQAVVRPVVDLWNLTIEPNKPLSFAEIVRSASRSFGRGSDGAEFAWRALSGATHGDLWAALSIPHHTVLREYPGEVIRSRVTLDITDVAAWTSLVFQVAADARHLYTVRSTWHVGKIVEALRSKSGLVLR